MVGTTQYDFTDDVAIVTGSTKGIGRGIAEGLATAGADVVVNSRTPDAVEKTAAELDDGCDGTVLGIAANAGDSDDIDSLVQETIDAFGTVDLLVNNAAVWPARPIHEVEESEWDLGLDVNAKGPWIAAKRVAAHLIERGEPGSIVNVTSQAGERHGAGHGLYGVSKAAQNGLTWRLAHELGPHGIRVNAVSTSQTDSHALRKGLLENAEEEPPGGVEELLDELAEDIPLRRVGQPEDIADAVCYLASDAASYVTGHVLRVSGGNNLK